MCGRVHLTHSAEEIADFFDARPAEVSFAGPRFNVAPGALLPVLRSETGSRRLSTLRWGLVPAWAKDPKIGYRMINARSETAAEKPSFRGAWKRRRCAVVVSGYYEWWRRKPKARPERAFRFRPAGDPPVFALAGLWERWAPDDGEALETCTILTTDAAEPLQAVHHRMPVMLPTDGLERWLAEGPAPPLESISPPGLTGVSLVVEEVGTVVNDARHDDPECLRANPPLAMAERLMLERGWSAGFDASPDGPVRRWADPASHQPGRLVLDDPELARSLLAEMDSAGVDLTGVEGLPPSGIAEAWLTWRA